MPSWHGSICKMANYEEALKYADMALEQNDTLYDWISYYNSHKEAITKEDSYPSLPSATGYDYVENYYFRCGEGNPNYATSELNIPVERAESFEGGDARFLSRWKLRTVNQDTYYQGLAKGYFNGAGLTTCEDISSRPNVWHVRSQVMISLLLWMC